MSHTWLQFGALLKFTQWMVDDCVRNENFSIFQMKSIVGLHQWCWCFNTFCIEGLVQMFAIIEDGY